LARLLKLTFAAPAFAEDAKSSIASGGSLVDIPATFLGVDPRITDVEIASAAARKTGSTLASIVLSSADRLDVVLFLSDNDLNLTALASFAVLVSDRSGHAPLGPTSKTIDFGDGKPPAVVTEGRV
jgi:hypothetical protein